MADEHSTGRLVQYALLHHCHKILGHQTVLRLGDVDPGSSYPSTSQRLSPHCLHNHDRALCSTHSQTCKKNKIWQSDSAETSYEEILPNTIQMHCLEFSMLIPDFTLHRQCRICNRISSIMTGRRYYYMLCF